MELRARISPFARRAAFTAALGALLVPAVAGTAAADAAKRKAKRYPVVTSVRPMDARVGQTIVLRGRAFKRGKNKNTVVFKRDGARAVFMKSTLATAKQIAVVVPETRASSSLTTPPRASACACSPSASARPSPRCRARR